MDEELDMDDGECVVGCGCGCGLEEDDERSRMEAYIDEVRAANAAGQGWEEGSEWLQMASLSQPATPGVVVGGDYGDFMTGGVSKMMGSGGEDPRRERLAGTEKTTKSPTPTTKKKDKGKGKKKVRASGLSYY